MLDKTSFLSKTAAICIAVFIATAAYTLAGERTFEPNNSVIRGQNNNNNNNRNNPGLGQLFRQTLNRILQEDSPDQRRDTRPVTTAPPGVPTQPPRPLTAAEIQQSHSGTASTQGQRTGTPNSPSSTAAQSRTASPAGRSILDDRGDATELSSLQRMHALRTQVFENLPAPSEAAPAPRQSSTPNPPQGFGNAGGGNESPRSFSSGISEFADLPAMTPSPQRSQVTARDDFAFTPQAPQNQFTQHAPSHIVPHNVASPFASPQNEVPQHFPQAAPRNVPQPSARPALLDTEPSPASQRITSATPQLHIDVDKPPTVTVNQEVTFRVRVTNIGDAHADGVVISTEIPSWIDVPDRDATNGDVRLYAREDGTGTIGMEWRINRINPGVTEMLVLRVIPRLHRAIELLFHPDFQRPAIVTKVEVREPRLEMELLGPDEILWNDTVVYRLNVRNVGNGNAENVRLDLQQTSAGESFLEFPEPLLPGETHELGITLQAGREREHIDLAIVATGSHNVKAEVHRRLRVLRPRLEMSVQTVPLHFVENKAEIVIRVWNVGTADADNVTVKADLPLGVEYASSTDGGMFFIQQQQNIVEWRAKHIARGDMLTLTLVCIPKREGNCRVSVEANEPGGSVLIAGNATFTAEAVVDLDMDLNAPRGPIELGQEVAYEVKVTNTGTKAAEDVEILMTFGPQLEPVRVGGGDASKTDDGLVAFDKIPAILPKQSVTVNVVVQANSVGTAQIRAEVIRPDANGLPIRLEKGLSAYIVSRQGGAVVSSQTQDEVFR